MILEKPYRGEFFGKWILVGEHAVLRGSSALVFPLKGRSLQFSFAPAPARGLHYHFSGEQGEEYRLLLPGLIQRACELLKVELVDLQGEISIETNLPLGAGLGASAALSVAVARWLEAQDFAIGDVREFACELENLFHGESSGVDVAVAISNQGLLFKRGEEARKMSLAWVPPAYLSYTGKRGVTSDCVAMVKALHRKDPELGRRLDAQMAEACEKSLRSLAQPSWQDGKAEMIEAMQMAAECFASWGLSEGPVADHMKALKEAGALAVKPTGSGDGGFVLSLWEEAPPPALRSQLISCF